LKICHLLHRCLPAYRRAAAGDAAPENVIVAGEAGPTAQAFARRRMLGVGLVAPAVVRAATGLSLGVTPVFLDSDLVLLRELGRELSRRAGQPVHLVRKRTYRDITDALLAGQMTAAWICGYPFVRHRDRLALVAVPVWRGRPLYQSYVIARADQAASDLAGLRGHSHAFSDPDSNSGWLVTAHALVRQGTTPQNFFSRSFFTYGHRNVVRAVDSGLADSGSVDGYVWEVLAETEPQLVERTRVLARSGWLGFPPIACLADQAGGAAVRRLHDALLSLPEDADGRALLGQLRLDGFADAPLGLFDPIARLAAEVAA
jgi:phosphonate transport system substrate-binding protein